MISASPDVVERVRMEYLEMPGLALTCCQATRLFNLDPGVCADILAQLVREHFLSRGVSGAFLRSTVGQHPFQTRQVDIAGRPGRPTCATAERI